jgi:hypothetical protein
LLAAEEPGRARAAFRGLASHPPEDTAWLREGARLVRRFPAVRRALAELVAQHPRPTAVLLARLGMTKRLGGDLLAPVTALEAKLAGPPAIETPGAWSDVATAWPGLADAIGRYVALERVRGSAPPPPPAIRELVEQPARLARELAHVEGVLAARRERHDLRRRAETLRVRLLDRARLLAASRDEAGARLAGLIDRTRLELVERAVADCYRARLEVVVGAPARDAVVDDDLLNALLLSVELDKNRRLLRRLLGAHLDGDTGWRERHPANAAFLAGLAARGVDVARWLSRSPRWYSFPSTKGGRVRVWLETHPLRVLQMGNYFGTCLSSGSLNAFATVANAAELNKRVAYAADGAGRVVGRQLIGLTAEGKLVGFRTYTRLGRREDAVGLCTLIVDYLRDFARRCRLELADDGVVPRLFAEDWYDDGVVPWASPRSDAALQEPAATSRSTSALTVSKRASSGPLTSR